MTFCRSGETGRQVRGKYLRNFFMVESGNQPRKKVGDLLQIGRNREKLGDSLEKTVRDLSQIERNRETCLD